MSRASALLTLALLIVLPSASMDASAQEPGPVERVAGDLKEPVDFAFGRDGYVYYTSLTARELHRLDMETGEVDEDFAVVFPNATWQQRTETGLFGLALDPDFAQNGVLYASYSQNLSGEWQNVLSRVTLLDQSGRMKEEVLMTRPGGIFHNGGRVLVADGHLWWTTGDATNPFTCDPKVCGQVAQEDGVMRGKIIRLTMDGQPAPDNPWGDAAYTRGHRNVYGIAWDPEQHRLLVTENGNALADELNILEPGKDYGWPDCEGHCKEADPAYTDPVHATNGTIAPTGAAWFRGAFWFGSFNRGDLMRASDASGEWVVENVYHYGGTEKTVPRMLDVEVGPDGNSLWFSAWTELWRVSFAEDPAYPVAAVLDEGPFWWNGTDPDPLGDPDQGPAGTVAGPALALSLAAIAGVLAAARTRPLRRK